MRTLGLCFTTFVFVSLRCIKRAIFGSLGGGGRTVFFSLLEGMFVIMPLACLFPCAFHVKAEKIFLTRPVSGIVNKDLYFVAVLMVLGESV